MKKLFTLVLAVMMTVTAGPLGAQESYVGTTPADGVYTVPANPGPGTDIRFQAESLVPDSDLSLTLFDENGQEADDLVLVAGAIVVPVDSAGNVDVTLRLPSTVVAGTYTIRAIGQSADLSGFRSETTFQVAAAQTTTDDTNTDAQTLALTGSEPQNRALGGMLLVGLGLGLVVVASRRREEATI